MQESDGTELDGATSKKLAYIFVASGSCRKKMNVNDSYFEFHKPGSIGYFHRNHIQKVNSGHWGFQKNYFWQS
jgi:hypothetical protein